MGLFSPKWKTKDEDKLDRALAAVRATKKQDDLITILHTAPLREVRVEAAKKLSDPSSVRRIAHELKDVDSLEFALRYCMNAHPDQGAALIEEFAGDATVSNAMIIRSLQLASPELRKRAISLRSSDQDFLMEVALHAPGRGTQAMAARLLTDFDKLSEIVSRGFPKTVTAAIERMTSLYPERALAVKEDAIVKHIHTAEIQAAVEVRKTFDEARDPAAFDMAVAHAMTTSSYSFRGGIAKEALPLIRAMESPDALMRLALCMDYNDINAVVHSRATMKSEPFACTVYSKLPVEQLVSLATDSENRLQKYSSIEKMAIWRLAVDELARRSEGQEALKTIAESTDDPKVRIEVSRLVKDEQWRNEFLGVSAPAAPVVPAKSAQPAGSGKPDELVSSEAGQGAGGYSCKSCGKLVLPDGDSPTPCTCPFCGTANHDWHHVDNVTDYRDYSVGNRYDRCERYGAIANYYEINTL